MSNVIRFLETMGSNADLRYAAKSTQYNALNAANVDQDAQWAVLRGDKDRLESLLGARTEMVCAIDFCNVDEDVARETHLVANAA
jgi:hypothetical protein